MCSAWFRAIGNDRLFHGMDAVIETYFSEMCITVCHYNWHLLLLSISQDPEKAHPYPTVTYTGKDPRMTDSICVAAEGLTIDVVDVTSSVSLLLSMYWAFNIQYAPSIRNSLCVLERMMGVEHSQLTSIPLRIITALSAWCKCLIAISLFVFSCVSAHS